MKKIIFIMSVLLISLGNLITFVNATYNDDNQILANNDYPSLVIYPVQEVEKQADALIALNNAKCEKVSLVGNKENFPQGFLTIENEYNNKICPNISLKEKKLSFDAGENNYKSIRFFPFTKSKKKNVQIEKKNHPHKNEIMGDLKLHNVCILQYSYYDSMRINNPLNDDNLGISQEEDMNELPINIKISCGLNAKNTFKAMHVGLVKYSKELFMFKCIGGNEAQTGIPGTISIKLSEWIKNDGRLSFSFMFNNNDKIYRWPHITLSRLKEMLKEINPGDTINLGIGVLKETNN